ncbi:TPA: branched-chain amino acid ABC transporter permease [Candidatus Bathyarchaeota archaeon]|nr:branched-chain amino acid ABC transporter permease [Candidatus Bathyarchaeota archaeon]
MFSKRDLAELIRNKKFIASVIAITLIAAIPAFLAGPYALRILTLVAVFTIYASSWNLLAYSGQGSLGHALFLGIGGFGSSLIAINLGVPPLLGLLLGGLFAAIIGLLIGLACVRLKAWFLAMVTFGASVIAVAIVSEYDNVFHGILGFPPPTIVPPGYPFYLLAIVTASLSVFSIYLIMNSKLGLAFKAIRENEMEARMIGIHTAKYKLLAFVISTFFAGIAGGLYVQTQSYVDSSVFSADNSFKPLMMAVIGGLWTIGGPIIGSAVIVAIDVFLPSMDKFLQPVLHPLFPAVSAVGPPLRLLGLGLFLVLVVIFLPKGIISLLPKVTAFFREEPKGKNK